MNEDEIELLKQKLELAENNLEYYRDIVEKHFHSPKEKYGLVNLEDGSIISAKEIQKEINALRSYHTQLTKRNGSLMLLEEEKTSVNIKNQKHERRFLKLYYVSLRNLTKELDVSTLGLLQKLIQHIRIDGTNGLIGSSIKSDWFEIVGMNKISFNKHFKLLEEMNVVKFIRNQGIFINPYYARYGNEIEISTLDLFGLEFHKGELRLKNDEAET